MTVIAMTREMGSRGREVALRLAEQLGLEIVQHEVVDNVAQKMQLRESSVNHLLEGTESLFERWGINRDDLSLYTAEEILQIAERGNVLFRGWGATCVLRKVPHVLCVRLCASQASRVQEMQRRLGLEDARLTRREIERNDAAHTRVMAGIFHADWRDPLEYDLVLNTDRIPVSDCTQCIADMVRNKAFQPDESSRAILHGIRLQASVQAALREHAETRRINPSFSVDLEPGTGVVTLSGIVLDNDFKTHAAAIVAQVPGVTRVIDEMYVPKPSLLGP